MPCGIANDNPKNWLLVLKQGKWPSVTTMIARLHRMFFFSLNSLDREAIGVLTSSRGWVGYVHVGAGMFRAAAGCCSGCCCLRVLLLECWLAGAAGCRWCLRVLLLEWCVCVCACALELPLQSAASGCCAVAGCRCWVPLQNTVRVPCALWRMLLQVAAVREMCALWSWPGCRCRVQLQGTVPPQGADAGAGGGLLSKGCLILGAWVPLQGTALRVRCALWSLGAGVAAGWVRDGYGSAGVGPWWRFRWCCGKKGEHYLYLGPMQADLFFVYLCIFIADIGRNGSDEDKHGERGNCNSIHSFQGDHKSFQAAVS